MFQLQCSLLVHSVCTFHLAQSEVKIKLPISGGQMCCFSQTAHPLVLSAFQVWCLVMVSVSRQNQSIEEVNNVSIMHWMCMQLTGSLNTLSYRKPCLETLCNSAKLQLLYSVHQLDFYSNLIYTAAACPGVSIYQGLVNYMHYTLRKSI